MKFKVGIHKLGHVADMQVEADDKFAAARKVRAMLDTSNGVYILTVDIDSLDPVMELFTGDKVRVLKYPTDLGR